MTFYTKGKTRRIEFEYIPLTQENKDLLNDFSCGNDELDKAFRQDCINDTSSVTNLVVDKENNKVICVYSLNCASIIGCNEGKHYPRSAVEIKYFAMNIDYQDIKSDDEDEGCLSSAILYDINAKIFLFTENFCGAEFIFLYSTPEGEPFYRKCQFDDFPIEILRNNDPYLEGCIPLCLKIR